jgi:hypothetical protein
MSLITRIVIWLIGAYQKILSPDQSWLAFFFPHGYCRFYPNCSEYTKQALIKYGLAKGLWLGLKRIGRCHPWHQPQTDQLI